METDKNTGETPATIRAFSVSSLVFGVLGGVFYWWLPMGIVLSLTGLVLGLVDWTIAHRRSLDFGVAIIATLLSAIALSLDIVIAYYGLQTVTFGGK